MEWKTNKSNHLTLYQMKKFGLVQIESICRRQNKFYLKIDNHFGISRKHCGKRRKCWSPAFSPFPTMFSKGFSFRVVESLDCVVKSKSNSHFS